MRRLKFVKPEDALLEVPTHENDGVFTYSCLEVCDMTPNKVKNLIKILNLKISETANASSFTIQMSKVQPGEHKKDMVTLFAAALSLLEKFPQAKVALSTRHHFMDPAQNIVPVVLPNQLHSYHNGTLTLSSSAQLFLSQAGFKILCRVKEQTFTQEQTQTFYKEFKQMTQHFHLAKGA